ncbi:MAG: hypothetical protein ACR2JF_05515 [Iamia sp.]
MVDPRRDRRPPSELTDGDVNDAIDRIAARDAEQARDARHVYETLTWGEGPAQLRLAGVQEWLWYRLATKYMTDEVGYMTRLAATAAELFDELGLDGYAALCRSETTAAVHGAYETSDAKGIAAMRRAASASGIDPPDLWDFAWGQVMGMEESRARTAVEDALERAIAEGELTPGGRGWRSVQREMTQRALDVDHPLQPGQSWRTAVITERIGAWVDEAARRSETLGRLRAAVGNRLLHPVPPPPDVAELLAPLTWLLDVFGDEQTLTQVGYLNTTFVRRFDDERPWEDRFPRPTPARSEADDPVLSRLRALLEALGGLRKRGRTLRRTKRGVEMASDPSQLWTALTEGMSRAPWERFVAETSAVVLLDVGGAVSESQLRAGVAGLAADTGWMSSGGGGGSRSPSEHDVSWAFSDTRALLQLFGMLTEHGDWRDRRLELTRAGETTLVAMLRVVAAGPRERPW